MREFRTLEIDACKAFKINPYTKSGARERLHYFLKKAFEMGKQGGEVCEKCNATGLINGTVCLTCKGVGMT